MDGRARIAASGIAAFAVTATVVATVITTNVVAFADSPGSAIDAAPVDVRATAPAAAPLFDIPGDVAAPAELPVETPQPPVAETVPAPAPVVVAPTAPVEAAPAAPAPAPETAAPDREALRAALASGDEAAIYAWAEAHGWSRDEVDRFLAEWREDDDEEHAWRGSHGHYGDRDRKNQQLIPMDPPANAGSHTVTESPQRGDGSKRNRSPGSPDPRD